KEAGGEAFRQLIERAEGFFDYYLNRLCATHEVSTDKGRLAVLRGMGEAVHKTGNGVLIDKYAQKTALRLGVSPEAVRAEFGKLARYSAPEPEPPEEFQEVSPSPVQPPSTHEHWLVKLLLLHEELVEWAVAHLDPNWVQHALVRQIVDQRLRAYQQQTWSSLGAFLSECVTSEAQRLITEAAAQERALPNPAQQLADVVLRLRNQFIERQMAALMQRANQPQTAEAERIEILRQQQELRALKRQPLGPLGPEVA
ncbi:MAG TPA: hypothetical protein VNT26_17555, partial [Candidatus Sulfotelmatobacter sp.]|nr:hypothetical protein [Candidatus Sulfotelmatobacter sp.]